MPTINGEIRRLLNVAVTRAQSRLVLVGDFPYIHRQAKKAVLKAFEAPLSEGLASERKSFYFLFASEDQKEGMHAFLEKRKGVFRGQ